MENNSENELLDVYGEDNMETGEVLPKSQIHRDGLLHKSVQVWLLNEQNQVLMQMRSTTKKLDPGLWSTLGGHVATEEESIHAAVRELFEETGIQREPEDLMYLGTYNHTQYVSEEFIEREILDVYVTAITEEADDLPINDEVIGSRYFSIFELEKAYAGKDSRFAYREGAFVLLKEYIYGPGQI